VNPLILLPLIAIFAYFMMIRPAKARQRQQQEMGNALAPGVEVRTIGGMLAKVKAVDGDVVVLEPSPGVEMRFIRQAVAAITSPLDVPGDVEDDENEQTGLEDSTAVEDEVETETKAEAETEAGADEAAEAKAEDEPAADGDTEERDGAAKEAVAAGSAAKKA